MFGRFQEERGSPIIEMVLVLPILLLVIFGIMVFGVAINSKIAVTGAAREAARHYAIYHNEESAKTKAEEFLKGSLATNEKEFKDSFKRNQDVVIALSDGNDYVTVTVTYHQNTFVPNLFGIRERINLTSAATFKMERR